MGDPLIAVVMTSLEDKNAGLRTQTMTMTMITANHQYAAALTIWRVIAGIVSNMVHYMREKSIE